MDTDSFSSLKQLEDVHFLIGQKCRFQHIDFLTCVNPKDQGYDLMIFRSLLIEKDMKDERSMQAIAIPPTTPDHYISFNHALNLRFPNEDTGDWHFLTAFFTPEAHPRTAPLAGQGEKINTNPSLGKLGIRDMSDVLESTKVIPVEQPVYVANHYRAIADLAIVDLTDGKTPVIATPESINQWLDTEEQINTLVQQYLSPLRSQIHNEHLETFEQWLKMIQFQ